ncbi:Ig-like domain-containing protein [Algoriphagus formosus]|uniref:Ig-like domain-containing protein n=1 Tax=Algoriphagus formosus TaxID=2007308 RepID=UPI003F700888
MKRHTVILLLMVVFSCKVPQGKIEIDRVQIDFGDILLGQTVSDSVNIRNVGNSTVTVMAFPDCGCTIIDEGKIQLQPGENDGFRFSFSPGVSGFVQQKILLESSDLSENQLILLTAFVKTSED